MAGVTGSFHASIQFQAPELPRQMVPITQQRQETISTQLIVVVEMLAAQAQRPDSLLDHRLARVFDPIRVAMVGEALAQTTLNPGPMLRFTEEDANGVGGDFAALEPTDDIPSGQTVKHQLCSGTLSGHKFVFLWCCKWFIKERLYDGMRTLSIFVLRCPS